MIHRTRRKAKNSETYKIKKISFVKSICLIRKTCECNNNNNNEKSHDEKCELSKLRNVDFRVFEIYQVLN